MSLVLSGIHVEVKGFRLEDISFEVEEGRCLVIVGPSGAGKTLLLDTIAGLHRPRKGFILLDGRDVTLAPPEERGIGYLPQDLALFPHLSVRDNILFGARARRMPREKALAKARELAELLKIDHLLDRASPSSLSGGERQRVALARTLLVEPRVILLDEPFAALDSSLKRELILYLKEVISLFGTAVVHVTHDLQEAFLLADLLGVMLQGKLEQVGSREEVCYRPKTIGVAKLFAGRNLFYGEIIEERAESVVVKTRGGLRIEAPVGGGLSVGRKVVAGINPRDIMIIRPGRALRTRVRVNVFPARVTAILDGFGTSSVSLQLEECGERAELEIPSYIFRDLDIGVGSRVEICFKKDCLWILPDESNCEN